MSNLPLFRLSKPDIDKLQAKKTEKKSTTTTVVTIVSTKSNGHVSQTTVYIKYSYLGYNNIVINPFP